MRSPLKKLAPRLLSAPFDEAQCLGNPPGASSNYRLLIELDASRCRYEEYSYEYSQEEPPPKKKKTRR